MVFCCGSCDKKCVEEKVKYKDEKGEYELGFVSFGKISSKKEFEVLLKAVLESDGEKAVLKIIKASGYFISYNEDIDKRIEKNTGKKSVVESFVKENFNEKYEKKYFLLKKEAQYLREKRKEKKH